MCFFYSAWTGDLLCKDLLQILEGILISIKYLMEGFLDVGKERDCKMTLR